MRASGDAGRSRCSSPHGHVEAGAVRAVGGVDEQEAAVLEVPPQDPQVGLGERGQGAVPGQVQEGVEMDGAAREPDRDPIGRGVDAGPLGELPGQPTTSEALFALDDDAVMFLATITDGIDRLDLPDGG